MTGDPERRRIVENGNHSHIDELLHQEMYRPEDLAMLLDLDEEVIRHAVYRKALPAAVVGHDIVAIRRADVIRWLKERA
jgi:hypothetical protein